MMVNSYFCQLVLYQLVPKFQIFIFFSKSTCTVNLFANSSNTWTASLYDLFLRRNLKVNSQKIKDHAYKALVRPKLEYSSCILDPSHTNQIKQIEKVQRHAARCTCNRYHNTSSVIDMLEGLDWPTLQVRRLKTRLIMFYKIIHFQVSIYPSDLLFHSDSRTRQSNPNCYKHIQTSKDAYKYSFYPRTTVDSEIFA